MSGRNKKKKSGAAAKKVDVAAPSSSSVPSSSSSSSLVSSGNAARVLINKYFDDLITRANARHHQLLDDVTAMVASSSPLSSIVVDIDSTITGDNGVISRLGRVNTQTITANSYSSTVNSASHPSHGHSHGGHHHDDNDDDCHGHSHGHGHDDHNDEHGHSHGHSHSHGDDDACHGHGTDDSSHGHSHGNGDHGHSHGAASATDGPLALAVVVKPIPIYGGRVEVRESKDKGKYWVAKEAIGAGIKLFDESPSLLTIAYPVGYSTPAPIRDALSRCLLQHPTLGASLYSPDDLKDYPSGSSPDQSLANDDQWKRAAAQVQINGFNVNIGDGTCRCFVYDTMSAINHSCWPNADKIDDVNGPAAVWTIRDIAAGEEICISYSNEMLRQPRASRQSYLSRMWRFTCTCDRCMATVDMSIAPTAAARSSWTQLRVIESLLTAGDRKATDEDRRMLDALAISSRHLAAADAIIVSDQCRALINRGVFAVTHWRMQPMMLSLIDQLPQIHAMRPFALWLLLHMAHAWKLTLPRLSTGHMELIRLSDVWHDQLDEALAFLAPHYDNKWTQKLLDMYSTLGDGIPHAM